MDAGNLPNSTNTWQVALAGLSFTVLAICETLLVFDVLSEYFDVYFDFYSDYHIELESLAVFSLGIGLIIVGTNFWRLLRENRGYQDMSGVARGEFLRVLNWQCNQWELTDSEREIALLLIKGLTIQEVANVRDTKTGTIKSQCNAIYRKSGVAGRNELAAYFMEDLLGGLDLTLRNGSDNKQK
jgi:DNA-binding CsgD family transcriptional regulator